MYTDSPGHANSQAKKTSAPDETSPLLSDPSKAAKSHTSWLPASLPTLHKKQYDVEERSTGPLSQEEGSGNETRDSHPPKSVSVVSFVAVLYFGILPASP